MQVEKEGNALKYFLGVVLFVVLSIGAYLLIQALLGIL